MEEINVFPRGLTPFQRLLFLRKMMSGTPSELKTVSGSIIHITDALAKPFVELTASITPVQSGSGDPSTENVMPITGWTGVNVWVDAEHDTSGEPTVSFVWGASFDDVTWTEGQYIGEDGSIGTNNVLRYSSFIPIQQGNWIYKYTHLANNINTRIHGYNSSGEWISQLAVIADTSTGTGDKSAEIIVPSGVSYLRISTGIDTKDTPTSLSMLSDSDGIIYSGTLNLTTGVLTVTWGKMLLSESNEISANSASTASKYVWNVGTSSSKARGITNVKCDCYATENATNLTINDNCICGRSNSTILTVRDDACSTKDALLSARGDAEIVFELATPIIYQLTPTQITALLGENYIWADTGDVELQYYAEVTP